MKSNLIIYSFIFFFSFQAMAQPHVKPDLKISKNELEVSGLIGAGDRDIITGFQVLYRIPVGCGFKAGAGIHLFSDALKQGNHPGFFVDVSKFIGKKQKWIINSHAGISFFEHKESLPGINNAIYTTTENKERNFQLGASYRMNLSRKLILSIGGFYLNQGLKTYTEIQDSQGLPLNPFEGKINYGSGGIKIGIVF